MTCLWHRFFNCNNKEKNSSSGKNNSSHSHHLFHHHERNPLSTPNYQIDHSQSESHRVHMTPEADSIMKAEIEAQDALMSGKGIRRGGFGCYS